MSEPGGTPNLGGTPKEEFLSSVRSALGRERAAPLIPYPLLEETLPDLEAQAQEIRQRLTENLPLILDKFERMAKLGGWNLHRATGYEDAIEYAVSLVKSLGVDRTVRSNQLVFDELPLDSALTNLGVTVTQVTHSADQSRESLRQEIIASGLGLTGADYAVAETGTVVIMPRRGLSRLVSLVPPVHLALVRPQDVVETLADLFLLRRLQFHSNDGEMGSYLNFITGPSRTADIESTLVVGVHGPKEVHLVLLDR